MLRPSAHAPACERRSRRRPSPAGPRAAARRRLAATLASMVAVPLGAQSTDAPSTGAPSSASAAGLPPWAFGPFVKHDRPILAPDSTSTFRQPRRTGGDTVVRWEAYATFNPAAAVLRDGRVALLYRAEDASGDLVIGGHTSRLGLATSRDGVRFTRRATPVLFPAPDAQAPNEWPGGVEDPRLVRAPDGRWVLTYTQWNRQVPRLAVATSRDLVRWTKHGPAFAGAGARYTEVETKSGAILTRVVGGRLVAARVRGRYWMYWGVPTVRLATSPDLVRWTPVETADGASVVALAPRPGRFDSWLVEAGPPPVLTRHGIVVLYNAGNDSTTGDPTLPPRAYSAGQALFAADDPGRLVARTDVPFLRPTAPWERTGQYTAGTTFVEALVPFRGRWFLYYGTADSRVGVAVWTPPGATAR